jgi:hypothetical protein
MTGSTLPKHWQYFGTVLPVFRRDTVRRKGCRQGGQNALAGIRKQCITLSADDKFYLFEIQRRWPIPDLRLTY